MKEIRHRTTILSILLLMILLMLIAYISYNVSIYGTHWIANARGVGQNKSDVIAGNIYDRNNVLLRHSDEMGKRLADGDIDTQKALAHVLGDNRGIVKNSSEIIQARYLYGFDENLMDAVQGLLSGKKRRGNNISLTIDAELQKHCADIFSTLEQSKNGAIVVMNYKTGEIHSLLSLPTFEPFSINDTSEQNMSYINRATEEVYPAGDAFTIITMASAIKSNPDILNKKFVCTGKLNIDNTDILDNNGAIHNNLDIIKAMEQSCKTTFAQIALDIKSKSLRSMAGKFAFNKKFIFRDIVVKTSEYPMEELNGIRLANAGVGQGKIELSPVHMCMIVSAIANNGTIMEPYLLKTVYDTKGNIIYEPKPIKYTLALNEDICNNINRAMIATANNGTAMLAKFSSMQIAGIVGTGYSGDTPYSWFAGYSIDKPYAISILIENSANAAQSAAPIAAQIFEYLSR